ncbi:hypothetical protein CDAR_474371 [Caerostris darwini]|uniref:Maturase K n=1 Tax=Caerostris darwini TaxID=1538125 RepID=A0AAV4M5R7_9ARAC|nr:hypothetical protein CDAR_474371 [Caerostris darwini]
MQHRWEKKLLYNFNSTDHPYTYSALLFTPTVFLRGHNTEKRKHVAKGTEVISTIAHAPYTLPHLSLAGGELELLLSVVSPFVVHRQIAEIRRKKGGTKGLEIEFAHLHTYRFFPGIAVSVFHEVCLMSGFVIDFWKAKVVVSAFITIFSEQF